ncbi:MAG: hypothetical protein P8M68_03210 [Aquiluna sp.]|nr:hypothetical protein [Aquiluna sp.]
MNRHSDCQILEATVLDRMGDAVFAGPARPIAIIASPLDQCDSSRQIRSRDVRETSKDVALLSRLQWQ